MEDVVVTVAADPLPAMESTEVTGGFEEDTPSSLTVVGRDGSKIGGGGGGLSLNKSNG